MQTAKIEMTYDLPRIDMSNEELLWLKTVYSKFVIGEEVNHRVLKVALLDQLPKGFNPRKMDSRLIAAESIPTLWGMYHLDAESKFIENTDLVIRTIRNLLLQNPNNSDFKSDDISEVTKISQDEVAIIFALMRHLDNLWTGATSYGKKFGYYSISVRDEYSFDKYIWYEGIEALIKDFIKRYEPQEKNNLTTALNHPDTERADGYTNRWAPIFRSKVNQIDRKLCFVLMPFGEKWSNRVYKELIREIIEGLGLQCLRADNLHGQIVIEDIWTKINQCAFIIADVTMRNPNVMYELGIVHTIGKPAILITQDTSTIPFDFTHLRHYRYEDNVEGFRILGETLPCAIREIYREHYPEEGFMPIKE